MSGNHSRNKGRRFEVACVNDLQAHGLGAERIPLSGAMGGSFAGDITVPIQGIDRRIECKCSAKKFTDLYTWLPGNYALFIKRDRAETLVVMRLQDFAALSLPIHLIEPSGELPNSAGGQVRAGPPRRSRPHRPIQDDTQW